MKLATLALMVMVLGSAQAGTIDVDGGAKRTARALRSAAREAHLAGDLWLGKLRGVGGGRDTMMYVPMAIDTTRAIDVVIYMDGIGSFDSARMGSRHVAAMTRLAANTVYVSPDAPSSTLGTRDSNNEHWARGCGDATCAGGHAAPGDFLVFLDEVRTKLAAKLDVTRNALDLRVSLIGFSRGGKGLQRAVEQLAAAKFVVGGIGVRIADVVYADGNYRYDALDAVWAILEARPEQPRMTVLVGAGDITIDSTDGNRRRAAWFWRSLPTPSPRLRLVPLSGGHHAIGDAAVDFLGRAELDQTT